MLGTKIYKDTLDRHVYVETSAWCGLNNCNIQDKGDYYEVCKNPAPSVDSLARNARQVRNQKIAETDYLLMVDYPLPEEDLMSVKEYRQALRDVPNQPHFPVDIEWPDLPKFLDKRGL